MEDLSDTLFEDEAPPSFYKRDEEKTAPAAAAPEPAPAAAPAPRAPAAPAPDEDLFADEDVPSFYKRSQAAAPAAAPAGKNEPWAITRGLYQGGVKQNLQALQDAAEMAGVLGDSKAAQALSDTIRNYKEGLDASGRDMSLKVPSISDIHGIGDVGTYIAEQLGSAIGSSGPSLTAGIVTGAATSEAGPLVSIPAGLAAAGAVSYLQNAPAVYRELLDAGMTDKVTAAKWAMGAGAPIAALDTIGEKIPLLRALGVDAADMVKKTIIKRIAETAAKSAVSEGITETAQQIITDATARLAADKPFGSMEELKGWADNFLGGAIGGAGLGGVAGVRPVKKQPAEEAPKTGEGDKTQASDQHPEGEGAGAHGVVGGDAGTTGGGGVDASSAPPPPKQPEAASDAAPAQPVPTGNGKVDVDQGAVLQPAPEEQTVAEEDQEEEAPIAEDQNLDETLGAAFDQLTAGEPEPEPEVARTGPPQPAVPETLGTPASAARKAIRRGRGRDQINDIVDNVSAAVAEAPAPAGQIATDTAADVAEPMAALGQAPQVAAAAEPAAPAEVAEAQAPVAVEAPSPMPVEAAPAEAPLAPPPSEPAPPLAPPEEEDAGGFDMMTPDDDLFADETPETAAAALPLSKGEEAIAVSRTKSETKPEQIAPAERAPVQEPAVAQRATKRRKIKEIVFKKGEAKPAAVEGEVPSRPMGKPRSVEVKNLLRHDIHEEVRTKLAGDYDKATAEAAVEEAMQEHADEADSSQHDSIGAAAKALRPAILERAKQLAVEKTAAKRTTEAKAKAEEVVSASERAKAIAEKRLREGEAQEKERTGKHKGKSGLGVLHEDQRTWERRYEDSAAGDERTQEIKKLLKLRGGLKGGNQKDVMKARARKNIADQLEAFREEDRQAARGRAEQEAAAKPKVDKEAEVVKQAKAYEKTPEEVAEAEEAARRKARAAKHAEHDQKFEATVKAHPEPDVRRARTMREANEVMQPHVMAFYNDLKARIREIPAKLDPRQSKAENFLVAAKRLLGKADAQGRVKPPIGDRLNDMVLLEIMAKNSTPQEFYDQLDKLDGDMREGVASYDASELEDAREAAGDYTGRGPEERDDTGGLLREELSPEELEEEALWRFNQAPGTVPGRSEGRPSSAAKVTEATPVGLRSTRGEIAVAPEDIESLSAVLDRAPSEPRSLLGTRVRSIYQHLRGITDKQIRARLADVPVYWVYDNQMRELTGSEHGMVTHGTWLEPTQAARVNGAKGAIVLNKNLRNNPDLLAKTVRHEGIHGLTVYAVEHDIGGAGTIMEEMIGSIREQLDAEGRSHVYDDPFHEDYHYGLKNTDEFITEAFSNPEFQEFLANLPMPANVQRKLGNHKLVSRETISWWDGFMAALTKIMKLSGFGLRGKSYLEGVVRLSEPMMRGEDVIFEHAIKGALAGGPGAYKARSPIQIRLPGGQWTLPGSEHLAEATEYGDEMIASTAVGTYETLANMADLPGMGDRSRSRWNKWKTGTHLAQDTVPFLGRENNPFFKIMDAVRRQGVVAKRLMETGDKLALRMSKLVKGTREEFADLVNAATLHNVDPTVPLSDQNNSHIFKKGITHAIKRANHAKLHARFKALPAEAQQLMRETGTFYKDMQNEMMRQNVETMIVEAREAGNVLPPLPAGMTDKQLEAFIMDGGIDRIGTLREQPGDKAKLAALGLLAPSFKNAASLRVVKGFYSPLMRRGQYLVRAKRRLVVPKGAQLAGVNKDQLIFRSKKDYETWAADEEDHQRVNPQIIRLKRDPATNKLVQTNATDPNAKEFVLVSPQLEYMEQFDTKREALAASKALRANPDYHSVTSPDLGRDWRNSAALMDILPAAQRKLIDDTTEHIKDAGVKEQVRRSLINSIMQNNVGTRIQQRQRKRRGVHGYDKDVARAMADYNVSASNQIARLKARPEINAGKREINREIEQRAFATDGSNVVLAQNLRSLNDNLKVNEEYDPSQPGSRFVQNMLAISFIKHLFSPANWIINSMQPGMVAMPYLGARHGAFRAAWKLGRAYTMLGSVKGGRIVDNLNAKGLTGEASMIEHLMNMDLIDAGMELDAAAIRKNAIEKGISDVAEFASWIPKKIEVVNRATTAIAAYQMAKEDGKTHEQATLAAEDAVNDTQGDYNQAVAPQNFKSSLLAKFVLQFKKYSQMMTRILARDARILFRPLKGESRKQAAKEIMLLMATHGMMAGAAGLPFMEVFKLLAIIANGLGLDDDDWDDWTNWGQNYLKSFMGDTLSEAVMRGAPRMLGVDVSSRMGLDSLITFGTPKTVKGEPQTKDWFLSNLIGAPADVVVQTMQGISDINKGDYAKAVTKFALPKVALDIWKAGSGLAGNKTKPSGIEIPGTQLNYTEAMWRALGFQSGRQQKRFESGTGYENKQHQKVLANRRTLMEGWLNGDKAERQERWQAIREWNKEHKNPKERITLESLYQNDAKRKRAMKKAVAAEAAQEAQ